MKKKKKYNNLKYQELLYSIKKYSKYVPLYDIFFENPNRLETHSIFNMYNYNISEIIHNNINITGFMAIAMAKQSKSLMDKFRRIDLIHQKNMEFDKTEVRGAVKKFSKILGVPCPKIRFASNTTMLIG